MLRSGAGLTAPRLRRTARGVEHRHCHAGFDFGIILAAPLGDILPQVKLSCLQASWCNAGARALGIGVALTRPHGPRRWQHAGFGYFCSSFSILSNI